MSLELQTKENKVCILDADSLIYRACFNKKDSSEERTLEECKKHLDLSIENILNFADTNRYIACLTIGRNFRYLIREDYKGNRQQEKPKYFKEVRQYLIERYKAIHNVNLESDDLCYILKSKIKDSFISSLDSDILYGLPGEHLDYKNLKWVITTKEDSDYKFWHDMIAGSHNGVTGLRGKGTKYAKEVLDNTYSLLPALEVLQQYIEHYDDIMIGIEQYYKNCKCLKIVEKDDNYTEEYCNSLIQTI